MPNSDRRNLSQQSQSLDENPYEEAEYVLPRNGLIPSIIIGFIGGIVAILVPLAIVLFNVSLFKEASRLGDNMPYQLAISITIWQCSGAFINLLIAFTVGMIAGRNVVKRKLGFLAGALTGGIAYLGISLIHYIPGYPDVISKSATTSATGTASQGILAFILFIVIYALIGGLISLWGATIATRKHPYYYSQPKA